MPLLISKPGHYLHNTLHPKGNHRVQADKLLSCMHMMSLHSTKKSELRKICKNLIRKIFKNLKCKILKPEEYRHWDRRFVVGGIDLQISLLKPSFKQIWRENIKKWKAGIY